jgi:hypothetical protein
MKDEAGGIKRQLPLLASSRFYSSPLIPSGRDFFGRFSAVRSAGGLVVSFQNLFREKLACCEVIGEKMNESAILAKDLPFLPAKFLRKLD